jgi:ABC-type sugar transport system permease subunit
MTRPHSDPQGRLGVILLAPIMVLLALTIAIPALYLLWLSLTDASPGMDASFVGLDNYVTLLADQAFQAATLRSVLFVVISVSLEIVVGFSIALLLQRPFRLRPLWMALVIAPYAVSPIVAVVMWKYMLDPSFGIVNYALTSAGLGAVPWLSSPVTSMAAIIIVAVWKEFSFTTIVLFAALTTMPKELVEAANVDGATPWQILWKIKIPLIAPAIFIVLLFRTIFALREFGVVWTLTGGGPGTSTEILSIFLYKQAFRYLDFGGGAATGWLMLIVTLLLSSFVIRRTYRGLFTMGDGK